MLNFDPGVLLAVIVAIPALVFLGFSCVWLAGWEPRERVLTRVTALAFSMGLIGVVLLGAKMLSVGEQHLEARLGNWFVSGEYEFPLTLVADRLSLPMLGLTMLLAGVIGTFSRRYLHRERGFFRFFSLLHLFAFGASLVFAAGSFDLLLGGWELVGISSVLLIGFFNERKGPVSNGLRVFGFYRIADLGLLLGIFALHHAVGSAASSALLIGEWPNQTSPLSAATATTVGLLFLLAASGKSAQVPFSSWLPRAMEGPTPSSAIFYGAISVHMGAYLLLRAQPILALSPVASAAAVGIGVLTAMLGTLSHRVSSDAKTSLAYATMTQLGLIFAEIGLGLSWLALAHIMGHALVRTLQFLRAPSMLHDYHRMHSAAYGHLGETGKHYGSFVPASVQAWLYGMGLERGYLDTMIDRFVISPVLRLASVLAVFEPKRNIQREEATNPAGQVLGEIDA
jgi:NADH:ubiquinone oxidoreductase subunit 5 (subunit L)/multisubunit Na+/H+ antiporter MnhA subunit